MPTGKRDSSKIASKQAAKVTMTLLPKGEDLLEGDDLKRQLREAKAQQRKQQSLLRQDGVGTGGRKGNEPSEHLTELQHIEELNQAD